MNNLKAQLESYTSQELIQIITENKEALKEDAIEVAKSILIERGHDIEQISLEYNKNKDGENDIDNVEYEMREFGNTIIHHAPSAGNNKNLLDNIYTINTKSDKRAEIKYTVTKVC